MIGYPVKGTRPCAESRGRGALLRCARQRLAVPAPGGRTAPLLLTAPLSRVARGDVQRSSPGPSDAAYAAERPPEATRRAQLPSLHSSVPPCETSSQYPAPACGIPGPALWDRVPYFSPPRLRAKPSSTRPAILTTPERGDPEGDVRPASLNRAYTSLRWCHACFAPAERSGLRPRTGGTLRFTSPAF